jgi:hypothetical protein
MKKNSEKENNMENISGLDWRAGRGGGVTFSRIFLKLVS